MNAKKLSKGRNIFRFILFLLLILGAVGGYYLYETFFKTNVYLDGKKSKIIYIPTGADFEKVVDILKEENILVNNTSFELTAKKLGLPEEIHPGRYRIVANMNNRQLISMLKQGKQEKVKLTLNSSDRTIEDLIKDFSLRFEIDARELEEFFSDETTLSERYGLNSENIRTLFIPGVYDLYWTMHLEELMEFLQTQHQRFWTPERLKKAKNIHLSPAEVSILASIVQCESGITGEQEKIAGVYINRLQKNMPLQADPTVVFATGKFDIQRVLNEDKAVNSPYNTYKHKGLPPGPICLPYPKAIDAVLNYKHHNYLYFCAKPDFSGYSDFSATYEQHEKYAKAYQETLDKKGIKR